MRQAIVDAHTEYPGLSLHEIARICYVQFNRKPSHHTIQLVLADGPKPSRTTRRFPRFDEITDPAERRRVIIRLHADGWMPLSIAEYLGTSRQTVHTTLNRWAAEQFVGMEDTSHARHKRALKTDLKAMNAVKRQTADRHSNGDSSHPAARRTRGPLGQLQLTGPPRPPLPYLARALFTQAGTRTWQPTMWQ